MFGVLLTLVPSKGMLRQAFVVCCSHTCLWSCSGKDQKDPENVKYDTPTRDPGDTADVAPGYYDDHGKGGERELAWEEQRKPDEGDPSYRWAYQTATSVTVLSSGSG